jgi:hypothetical protein
MHFVRPFHSPIVKSAKLLSINNIQQQFDVLPANFAGEKSFTEKLRKNRLPPEIEREIQSLGWRGSLADVEKAWREDPEQVRQWLWYARKEGMSGALLRTLLRSAGEYPPELDPSSEYARERTRRSYIEGAYAEFIEH